MLCLLWGSSSPAALLRPQHPTWVAWVWVPAELPVPLLLHLWEAAVGGLSTGAVCWIMFLAAGQLACGLSGGSSSVCLSLFPSQMRHEKVNNRKETMLIMYIDSLGDLIQSKSLHPHGNIIISSLLVQWARASSQASKSIDLWRSKLNWAYLLLFPF